MTIKMRFYQFVDKIFANRAWSSQEIKKYLGDFINSYRAYAADPVIRKFAASGGLVSAILIYCLERKLIDGALVCQASIESNKVRPRFFIAKNKEEVLNSQGSKYITTNFLKEALPLIKKFDGKLAVVGLPCDIFRLKKISDKNENLKKKIKITIGLFCGHVSSPQLIDHITENLRKKVLSDLTSYKFRYGTWRGKIRAEFANGTVIEKKTSVFNQFQNMYFFCEKKCFYCYDHFAYHADISVGDIWSYYLKDLPVKHSGVITRNISTDNLIEEMRKASFIINHIIDITEILNGQSRGVRLHYNLTAKSRIGSFFGLKIPDKVKEKTRCHEYIVVFIAMLNWKWSQSRFAPWIFKIPKPIIKLYLYFMKGLQALK